MEKNKPYYEHEQFTIQQGSMLDVLKNNYPDNYFDSIVADPPYEIGFMNKGWDNTGIAFSIDTWKECLRVLKPGGYLLAFNHSRTFHRMMVAIEDAGFELRDTIMWLYGSGFPKSHNIAKSIETKLTLGTANTQAFKKLKGTKIEQGLGYADLCVEQGARPHYEKTNYTIKNVEYTTEEAKKWDGWGTALKPAFEPIVMARKPFKGNVTDNVLKHGVGGINIDGCRISNTELDDYDLEKRGISRQVRNNEHTLMKSFTESSKHGVTNTGRFPANIIHDGSHEVLENFPNTKSGKAKNFKGPNTNNVFGSYANNIINEDNIYADTGSAARYFYCAKASKKDRNEGLEEFESKFTASAEFRPNHMEKAINGYNGNPYGRWQPRKNIHPTVKPTELMQYLIRLVTPKGGKVLDPFMGSGSTGIAVLLENKERNSDYHFTGIDLDKTEIKTKIPKADTQEKRDRFREKINKDIAKNKHNKNYKKWIDKPYIYQEWCNGYCDIAIARLLYAIGSDENAN